jgi:imidazole glycerol-phosphate synthase subunit HisH
MIGIVDYGMGNMHSVCSAFRAIGREILLVTEPEQLRDVGSIVLPGVGSFGDAMENLRARRLIGELETQVLANRKPYLGICLGLQILATTGFEHGKHAGLNWIPGTVEKLPVSVGEKPLRVPHIGWNEVQSPAGDTLFAGLGEAPAFYFVHSYVLKPNDPAAINGGCHYGVEFAASIASGNIAAVQFHPEKSHRAGLRLLRNWCERIEGPIV